MVGFYDLYDKLFQFYDIYLNLKHVKIISVLVCILLIITFFEGHTIVIYDKSYNIGILP